ncbi:hypothetical protein P154DRAFT_27248 [Amniculicola lignicola CBS 123094]|uniref:RRM domain-containing protein n=1 Tax=Amniculicola lignicola CBS 123094 TaxID=1392246 RepID=A0A6A5W358_9PLEO|nr:hypothetical protein P154DRAFT_27248 [Amniculicola lignicola CBS 123094]
MKPEQVNRAIYVIGIPKDANREEIEDEFGRFCGIIDVGADQKKRVKMYYNDDGTFKGEALIVFLRPESITSALNLMDDQPLRYGGTEKLQIQEADFSYKKEQVGATTAAKLSRADRKTLDLKRAELERARTAWSSDEEAEEVKPTLNKHAKIVIVRNVFTKPELDDDPTLISEIKEELIGTNSAKGREVTSVQVYDLEPEGIVTVKFKEFDHATAFLKQANGRLWEGIEGVSENRYIKAELASDRPKFRKSRGDEAVQSDSD